MSEDPDANLYPISPMNWYYESGGTQQGPISDAQLDQLLAEGKITPATLIWREGMGNWAPLREARPAAGPAGAPPVLSADMVVCDSCGKQVGRSEVVQIGGRNICAACKPTVLQKIQQGGDMTVLSEADRTGPAWEQRETLGTFPAAMQTIKAALLEPNETFSKMKVSGGIANPYLFHLLVGGIGSVCASVYISIVQILFMNPYSGINSNASPAFQIGILFGVVIRSIIFAAIGVFIHAGIVHVCLMICGGAKRPFEATFRAVCYGASSVSGLQVIPIIGSIAAIPWSIVVSCLALARAHETDTWRALVAILLPGVVCCGLMVFIMVTIFGAASAMHGMH